MTVSDTIVEKFKKLPLETQREARAFVESLQTGSLEKRPRRSLRGLWADLGVDITAEQIEEARRERWLGIGIAGEVGVPESSTAGRSGVAPDSTMASTSKG